MFIKLKLIFLFTFFTILSSFANDSSSVSIVELNKIEVIRVIDGDTIEVKVESQTEKIRLIGIQAPELFTDPIQVYANQSKQALIDLISNKQIKVQYASNNKRDIYGRILADIYLSHNNLWVNGYMIENGFAFTYIINSKSLSFLEDLIKLENKAIQEGKGIWAYKSYQVISPICTEDFIGMYKVVEAKILSVIETKNSIWLHLTQEKEKGFSLRIDKDHNNYNSLKKILHDAVNKRVRVRGFIDKYSPKYGAFIEIISPYMIELF